MNDAYLRLKGGTEEHLQKRKFFRDDDDACEHKNDVRGASGKKVKLHRWAADIKWVKGSFISHLESTWKLLALRLSVHFLVQSHLYTAQHTASCEQLLYIFTQEEVKHTSLQWNWHPVFSSLKLLYLAKSNIK